MKPLVRALAWCACLAGLSASVAAADTGQSLKILVPAADSRTSGPAKNTPDGKDPSKAPADSKVSLEGWTLTIRGVLLRDQPKETETAVALLQKQLVEIVRVVPAPAVAKLRAVPLWFSPEYPGIPPRAEYHPGAQWLVANHRDPAMAKGVEFTDIKDFERETIRMPNFTLHELAHAYHDRVLGFDDPAIRSAYKRAHRSGTYDRVERWFGSGRPNTFEKAYAMTNDLEYFAESTEAYFSRNDFFPFNREELEKHDPEMAALLEKVWNRDVAPPRPTGTPSPRGN